MTTKLHVISGGQSGADLGGLVAAERYGLIGEFGGWMPKGWLTEDGPKPEYEARFRMRECRVASYPARTWMNVEAAEATLWFGRGDSAGFNCTNNACNREDRPLWTARTATGEIRPASDTARLIKEFRYGIINIAGNRESKTPGIQAWVERYLSEVFELLGYKEIGG